MICPKYRFEVTDIFRQSYCRNCPDKDTCNPSPHFELPKVDVFRLAKLLAEKKKQDEESKS